MGYNRVALDLTVLTVSDCNTVAALKLTLVLVTEVILPLASTTNTGIVVEEP